MTQTLAISKTLNTLSDLEEKFQLTANDEEQFFTEWCENLPDLTDSEHQILDALKQRFLAHSKRRNVPEGAVDKLLVSRLLDMAGLFESRFTLRTEAAVAVTATDEEVIYRGRIDTLIIQEQLWVLVIEQKETAVSISTALPQLFAYMLSCSTPQDTVFGMVSNGHEFIFAKLMKIDYPQYAFSSAFTLFPKQNEMYEVLRILKRITNLIAA